MHPSVHSSIIYNSQVLEATYMPTSKWVDKKLWYIYTMEYYVAERKMAPILHNSMGGTAEYYDKWNKLSSERQIP